MGAPSDGLGRARGVAIEDVVDEANDLRGDVRFEGVVGVAVADRAGVVGSRDAS